VFEMNTAQGLESNTMLLYLLSSCLFLSVRADVDYALKTLGVDCIDIIVLCRVPHDVPIETSVTAMKALVDEGKAKHIGLSEAGPEILRRASAVAPIYCIEQEW
jgi:aryl-alcohol dehydrogenase-like predicted oxidoreductase